MPVHDLSPAAPSGSPAGKEVRVGPPEDTLKTEKLQVERKVFIFALKQNPRGRFLRITEDVGGRRDSIIIPAPGLEDFKRVLEAMVQSSAEPSSS